MSKIEIDFHSMSEMLGGASLCIEDSEVRFSNELLTIMNNDSLAEHIKIMSDLLNEKSSTLYSSIGKRYGKNRQNIYAVKKKMLKLLPQVFSGISEEHKG